MTPDQLRNTALIGDRTAMRLALREAADDLTRLRAALELARDTIEIWHCLPMQNDNEGAAALWQLYQRSPEMTAINEALERCGK